MTKEYEGERLERETDSQNEAMVRWALAKAYGVPVYKFPGDWPPVDSFGQRGSTYPLVAEIKCRNMTWEQYPDIVLAEHKFDSLMQYRGAAERLLFACYSKYDTRLHVVDVQSLDKRQLRYDPRGGRTRQMRSLAPNELEPIHGVEQRRFVEIPFDRWQIGCEMLAAGCL